jgi:hypothetical protein
VRRSDFDITDRICTTDPAEVGAEVMRLFQGLYPGTTSPQIERAFTDMPRMYRGEHPDYHPCDTPYHDIQHVLDVTLTMARLLEGYARSRNEAPLPPQAYGIGIVIALFHDVGYLRRRGDDEHRYGAEYTLTHVSRGAEFLRGYFPGLGWAQYAAAAAEMVHFTGYERPLETVRVADPLLHRVGEILGSADIMAQMADRCYLEKCSERLFPEFLLGGLASRKQPDGEIVTVYSSGADLVRKTPVFYANAMKRLDVQLHRAYVYAERHFGGGNIYLEEMEKNVRYAQVMAGGGGNETLRRAMPVTLAAPVRAFPEDLVIR